MAEYADRSTLAGRYAAIEQAYCADLWGEVIDQGQNLLQAIPRSSAPVPEGLKERVQLLMAHAHLYGFNGRDVAADLYGAVLQSKAEAALRQIAEQGLQRCRGPRQTTAAAAAAAAETDEAREPAPRPGALVASALIHEPVAAEGTSPRSGASESPAQARAAMARPAVLDPAGADSAPPSSLAMPWLVAGPEPPSAPTAGSPATTALEPLPAEPPASSGEAMVLAQEPSSQESPLIPEVVEEPELFEVHQADPTLAEDLELTVLEPATSDDGATSSLGAASELAGGGRRTTGMKPVSDLFRHPPAPGEQGQGDRDLRPGLLRVLVSVDSAGDGG